jgi:hypothetical protein
MLGDDPPLLSQTTSLIIKQPSGCEGHCRPVRWKLLIITSSVAALLGAGGIRALIYLMGGWRSPMRAQTGLAAGIIGISILLSTLAAIFVYRHTARRRKLQAALTALFALVMTVAVLLIAAQILPGRISSTSSNYSTRSLSERGAARL